MDYLSILGLILAIPNTTLVLFSQLSFWQRKEYRLDRVLSTLQDSELTWKRLYFVVPVTLFVVGYLMEIPVLGVLFHLSVLAFYIPRTIRLGFFRPQWTQKSILLSFLLVVTISLYLPFLLLSPTNLAIRSAALVLLIFPLTAVLTFVTNKITNPKKVAAIQKAKDWRKKLHNLQVVGITGSYGKTTTKQFLATLLPEAKVSKEHRNSDYVIALDMLDQLSSDIRQYIVEMSAYKAGEVSDLAKLALPSVGVITHIGNQHLSLFGSQENILNAKWELIDALPQDGIAVLNADDNLIVQKAKSYEGLIKWFSLNKEADVYAENVVVNSTNLEFTLFISGNSYDISVDLLSEAYLSSILAAVCAAHAVGVTDADIVARIKNMKPLLRTMQLVKGSEESLVIDDSYSASEQAVKNAIRHIQRFSQKDKRIVLVPLIELGSQSQEVHERIGKILKESECKVYVYGKAFAGQLGQEVFTDPDKLLEAVTSELSSDSVILLEGRVPNLVRKGLIK
jgi:UDP-N-acetylmuramoyl-tripeptide--D-alanyl-D-alanine ligase